jgi:hypothetical protein
LASNPSAASGAVPKKAAQSPSVRPFKLRLRLLKGDQFVYSLSMTGRATISAGGKEEPFQIDGQTRLRRTVIGVLSDGRYVMEERVLGGEMAVTARGVARKTPVTPAAPQIHTVNALGRSSLPMKESPEARAVRDKLGVDPVRMLEPFSSLTTFPSEPVAPGSSWQRKAGFHLPLGVSFRVIIDNKLRRLATVSGVSAAEVASAVRAPLHVAFSEKQTSLKADGRANGSLLADYSLTTGMPVRVTGSLGGSVDLSASGNSQTLAMPLQNGVIRFNFSYRLQMTDAQRGVDTSEIASALPPSSGPASASLPPAGDRRTESAASEGAPASLPPADEKAATPQPSVPVAELRIPSQGGKVSGVVPVQALVQDAGREVAYVAFLVNGRRPFVTNSRPFRFSWDTSKLPEGIYVLSAEVYGPNGELIAVSPARQVRIRSSVPSPPAAKGSRTARLRA